MRNFPVGVSPTGSGSTGGCLPDRQAGHHPPARNVPGLSGQDAWFMKAFISVTSPTFFGIYGIKI
jgi:hypothetical protein